MHGIQMGALKRMGAWLVGAGLAIGWVPQAVALTFTTTELTLPSGTGGCVRPWVNARGDVLAECSYKKTVKRVSGAADNPGSIFLGLFQSKTVSTTFYRPVLWKAGQASSPQVLPDAVVPTTSADTVGVTAFNANGEVLLTHAIAGVRGDSLWRNGAWQRLDFAAAGYVGAGMLSLNDVGALAAPVSDSQGNAAMLLRDRQGQDLRTPAFLRSEGYAGVASRAALNNLGQMALTLLRPSAACCPNACVQAGVCYPEPLVSAWWSGSAWQGLPVLAPGNTFLPVVMNDNGLLVGHAAVRDSTGWPQMHAFDGQAFQRIGTGSGEVRQVNKAGTVVGVQNGLATYKGVATTGAFVWRQGVLSALAASVTIGSGQALLSAPGINDAGQIVAVAADPWRSTGRLYLFTPK
jgi:hypothetical protein